MEEENVFTAKTVEDAISEGLEALKLARDEAEIIILEEGKKKLFGSVKAKVQIRKKSSDAKRAADFIDGLLEILKITAVSEVVKEGEEAVIDIKATNSAKVIGKHGDMLDAIQCLAGAVANMGREEYIKVIVDCENYRSQREETLVKLAEKVAAKAIEKGRKINLEPMTPYERRIIHSALSNREDVKTISEGKEPYRYVAILPVGANPEDRGIKYGERRDNNRRKMGGKNGKGNFRTPKRSGDRRERSNFKASAPKRAKKEIHFGTFLGNSGKDE